MLQCQQKENSLKCQTFHSDTQTAKTGCTNEEELELSYEPRHEKTNILVSDLVRHKPGCTATEDGQRLEISDLESRGIILSM